MHYWSARVCILNTVRWIHAYKKLRMSLALRAKWNRISILNERTISISQGIPGYPISHNYEGTISISQGILVRVSNASKVSNSWNFNKQSNSPQKVIYNHNSKFTKNFKASQGIYRTKINLQRPLELLEWFFKLLINRDLFARALAWN